jgi:hypothetical protein
MESSEATNAAAQHSAPLVAPTPGPRASPVI